MKWSPRSIILPVVLLAALLCVMVTKVRADNIVQGFNATGSPQPGWVVGVSKNSSEVVQPASTSDSGNIYGVVIDPSQAPLTVQRQGQQVYVASSGSYPVLVSTQNGSIRPGDYISVSSIQGVGAKATNDESNILGQALSSFDGSSNVITSANGTNIGRVTVSIGPGRNPLLVNDVSIPSPLRSIGQAIAGRSVSALRIYAALAIFLVTAIIAASLLYVGVRSGMTAIGRNPLSRHSILNSLSQVVVMACMIFLAGLLGIYLLLRL